MNKITIEEHLEDDNILTFRLSEQISEIFVFSDVSFSTINEPAREGILYAGPTSGHDAPNQIKRLVDPFYSIRGITDIQIDGNELSFFRNREADPYDATEDVIDCILTVMGWQKSTTEVVHELSSGYALFHAMGVKLPKGKSWLP